MIQINRFSNEIKENNERLFYNDHVVNIKDGENITFSKSAALLCGLKFNNYVHFLNDFDKWQFYTSNNKDGFKLCKQKHNLCIASKPLTRLILKTTGFNKQKYFEIKKTNIKYDGFDVFEMIPQ